MELCGGRGGTWGRVNCVGALVYSSQVLQELWWDGFPIPLNYSRYKELSTPSSSHPTLSKNWCLLNAFREKRSNIQCSYECLRTYMHLTFIPAWEGLQQLSEL